MNSPSKRKLWATARAALWGCLLFGLITVVMVVSEFPLELRFLIGAPVLLLKQILGLNQAPANSFVSSNTFGVIINSLFGAFLFGVPAVFWQFIVKGDNEQ